MGVYQKLLEIQREVIGLKKDSSGFGFKYVSGSKVIDFIKPLMNKQGLILKQEIVNVSNKRIDYLTGKAEALREKSEMFTEVEMLFTWVDCETGEKDENRFFANGMNEWEKGLGSALTYAERYFFLKYFHINTDEDDIDNPERKAEREAAELKAVEAAKKAKEAAELKERAAEAYKLAKTNELKAAETMEELARLYSGLTKDWKAILLTVKDEKKKELTTTEPAQ